MSEKSEIEYKVKELVEPILDEMGLELYDVNFHLAGKRSILRIFIDRVDGNVTIDDCAKVSQELSAILDVEDPIPTSYVLEVSSPGATRRLKNEHDFKRSIGKTVLVETKEPIENRRVFKGVLIAFEGNTITVEIQKKKTKGKQRAEKTLVEIPYDAISFARLELDLAEILGDKR